MDDEQDWKTLKFVLESSEVMQKKTGFAAFIQGTLMKKLRLHGSLKNKCTHCHRPWAHGFFTLKVRPKPVLGKRIRKIIRKQEEDPRKLSVFERRLLKFVTANQGNKLVLTCLSCQKSMIQKMSQWKSNYSNEEQKEEEKTTKFKKKRKKDIFVGLNPEVVFKTALMNYNSPVESSKSNINVSKKVTNSKTFRQLSLNDQNLFQASNPKFSSQPTDVECSFKQRDLQNKNINSSNNTNSNKNSKKGSLFNSVYKKINREKEKQKEIQRKIKNLRYNTELRKIVMGEERRESKKDSQKRKLKKNHVEKPDLKNFLKAFGNPVTS